MLGNFSGLSSADFLKKKKKNLINSFSNTIRVSNGSDNSFSNTIRVTNGSDPDLSVLILQR